MAGEAAGDARVKLTGELVHELFVNPDNGYRVMKLLSPDDGEVTVCGSVPEIEPGQFLEALGSWVEHPEYGRQFRAEQCRVVLPESTVGLKRFLGSGIIPGIGPKLAATIVDYFGEQTVEVLSNHVNRLREIPKFGPKKVAAVRQAWEQYAERRNGAIFLQGLGITPAYCARLYKRYGDNAAQLVRQNPYRLAQEVDGIGFVRADRIAASLGIGQEAPERLIAGAVYQLEQLCARGHCCYPRGPLEQELGNLLSIVPELAKSGVDQAVTARKLAADHDLLYLPGLLRAECELPRQIARLARCAKPAGKRLAQLPLRSEMEFSPEQLQAVAAVSAAPLSIITGGPGVGKTTVLGEIVRRAERAGLRLALAAPTGRAAKRLSEATGQSAKTLHRMLGYEAETRNFQHNQEKPLEYDLFLIDEVSMLDLPLAVALFRAIPTGATVVLIGDADQLPSVGPGMILADFLASEWFTVTRLTRIFRQEAESAIVTNAHRVNAGLPPMAAGDAGKDALQDFYWIEQDDPEIVLDRIRKLLRRIPERFGYDPVDEVQVLTPMNRGACGTIQLNSELQNLLNPASGEGLTVGDRVFRLDDKVMQIANNYDKNIFNGDIGRIRYLNAAKREIAVRFDSERIVPYRGDEFDELVHAYAITVHKAQGCEFPVVILTLLKEHFLMLERNLLYTAMTRAKKLLILIGGVRAVHTAVANTRREVRYTRLQERLAEMKTLLIDPPAH